MEAIQGLLKSKSWGWGSKNLKGKKFKKFEQKFCWFLKESKWRVVTILSTQIVLAQGSRNQNFVQSDVFRL
jgi:hypothetical protein